MDRILVGTTRHNSVNLDKGNVRHSGSGITFIGSNTENKRVDEIVQVFNKAGPKSITFRLRTLQLLMKILSSWRYRRKIALAMKHVEMLNEELSTSFA